MRRTATTALCCALVAAGCGGADDGQDAGGLAREASAVVEKLQHAIATGQFRLICSDLLSAEVRHQAGGGDCPSMLRRTSAGVKRPRIEVKGVKIDGTMAVVSVLTTAQDQARVDDTIRLVREAGAYRISSLSG